MILPWMIYAIGISAAFGLAAFLVEKAFRDLRWPAPRFVWWIAMVGSFVLPWIPRQSPTVTSAQGPAGAGPEFLGLLSGEPMLTGPAYPALDSVLVLAWLTLSLFLGIRTVVGVIASRRMARKWQPQRLAGNDVLLSESTGPAVTGFLGGRIVVPEWLLGWERESQQLVVRHELEHVWARDPVLRLFATLVCVAAPWNLPLWWHRRRMELAIELDCDRRVLAHYPDPERYGGLLLEVAEAGFGDQSRLPAFSHPASALERRIRMILTPHGPRAFMRSALTLIVATGVVVAAQSCSGPDAPDADYVTGLVSEDVVAPQSTEDVVAPQSTEDTVAPELTANAQLRPECFLCHTITTPAEARPLGEEHAELVRQQLLQSDLSIGEIRARLAAAGLPPDALDQLLSGDPVAPELTQGRQLIPTPEEARRLVEANGELVRQQLLQSGLSADEIRARLAAAGIPANALDQFFSDDAVAPQLTAGRLPYTPDDGQLEAELAQHHPGVLENGLPEGQSVWFIVDEDINVLRTGIDESEGLEERLQADYPAETTEYALGFGVPLGGDIVHVVWMVPEPPPGSLPGLD